MKKAYYESEKVTLYQGDALSILQTLPDGAVDAVVTDPPYSSGGVSLSARQTDPAQKYQQSGTKRVYPPMLGDGKDQRSFTAWAVLWLSECWRISKDGAPLLVFTDWRQLPSLTDAIQAAGWFWQGIVVWNKRSSRPQIGAFRRQAEYILFASKGRFVPATRACLPGVYDYPVITGQKVHLTSKPIPLLKDLLAIAPEGCTVLAPFIGGGTTAVAALETGRKCIGMELSKEYARLTVERIQGVSRG
jgi:site-specific DNA-methyltransferase (adenine-specific)